MIAAVVLAAGAGRRLGGTAKALLLDPEGRTFLERIGDTLECCAVGNVIVVVGPPYADAVSAAALKRGYRVLHNPEPERGMSSSIALGFASLETDCSAALLWPVDIPMVTSASVLSLIERSDPARVIVPTWRERGGHPALVGRDFWPQLSRCDHEKEGARSIFRKNAQSVIRVPLADPMLVRDIDWPADYSLLQTDSSLLQTDSLEKSEMRTDVDRKA